MRVTEHCWGSEHELVNNELYCLKRLELNPGFRSSLHYHHIKDETFFIYDGVVQLELEEELLILSVGKTVRIYPGMCHRFQAVNGPAVIEEVSTHHDDSDVVRLEPASPSE